MTRQTVLLLVTLGTLVSVGRSSVASRRQVPLDKLVTRSAAVVTGRTVAQEKREVAQGVFEVTQYLAIDRC